jgi:RNA polymerase sigma-70 factor (ECF subfamily)
VAGTTTTNAFLRAPPRHSVRAVDDGELVAALRARDEAAFAQLVRRYHARMVRVAEAFVASRAVAEEVAQDTWLGVVRGVGGFEGRSSLKTWMFRILVNRARTAGAREARSVPLDRESVERFDDAGGWVEPPRHWADDADERIAAERLAARVRECLPLLPDAQRQVVLLRDAEGLSSAEACAVLGITDGHQRVLLHRGRAHIRRFLAAEQGKD